MTQPQYTIENPYPISQEWTAYYFDWTAGQQIFAIHRRGSPVYTFQGGCGLSMEGLRPEACEIATKYLNLRDETTTKLSFFQVLVAVFESQYVFIHQDRHKAILDYLRDRAPVDPRAKQLLEEIEA